MGSSQGNAIRSAVIGIVLILANLAPARSQTAVSPIDQPNRVTIAYVAPKNPDFQELYGLLMARRALEKIQELLAHFVCQKS